MGAVTDFGNPQGQYELTDGNLECVKYFGPACALTDVTSSMARDRYLESIIRGEGPHLVLITGPSGSGKDTFATWMQSMQLVNIAVRTSTREPRPGEPPTHNYVPEDIFKLTDFVFAYEKGGIHYGYTTDDIMRASTDGRPTVVILGDTAKIQPFVCGLQDQLPLVPYTTFQMSVSHDEISKRLLSRATADPTEAHTRIARNLAYRAVDRGTRYSNNCNHGTIHLDNDGLRVEENTEAQIGGTAKLAQKQDSAIAAVKRAIQDSRDRSTRIAEELYYAKTVPPHWSLPADVAHGLKILEQSIQKTTSISGPILLKGGTAVAFYLLGQRRGSAGKVSSDSPCSAGSVGSSPESEAARLVSPDIDFMLGPEDVSGGETIVSIMEQLRGHVDGSSPVEVVTYSDKDIFKSDKASCEMALPGSSVDLDFIATSRVNPKGSPWTFAYRPTRLDVFMARTWTSADGSTSVGVLPPEVLALEKFLAGRGPELGKFDLWDASALACSQTFVPSVVLGFIRQQVYLADFDKVEVTMPTENNVLIDASVLSEYGIFDTRVRDMIVH